MTSDAVSTKNFQPEVSILIPHYKTLELVKLCLTLLERYTPKKLVQVIVIDNDSQDESVSYLESVSWIKLIKRKTIPGESPPLSHSRALDLGLEYVNTPYVLSIHTDTLVKHPDWLPYLLRQIKRNSKIAGVGSWKLENKSIFKKILKFIERHLQIIYYQIINKVDHSIEGIGKNYFYLRSHCALYRTDVLKKHHLNFSDNHEVAGKVMYKKLVELGYEMRFLKSSELGQYLDHINHATMVLNPDLGISQRAVKQGNERIKKYFSNIPSKN